MELIIISFIGIVLAVLSFFAAYPAAGINMQVATRALAATGFVSIAWWAYHLDNLLILIPIVTASLLCYCAGLQRNKSLSANL